MNQNYQQQYKLSLFINTVRDFLKGKTFFEHHLYSTIDYKIENTDSFKLKSNLYLRYNPEPDIWQVGIKHKKFFWIGSMFRDEKQLSNLHRNEFTVVDVYQSQGKMGDVTDMFIQILKTFEDKLKLSILSGLEIRYITHKEFSRIDKKSLQHKYWLIVTDYPVDESFYDTKGKENDQTSKFEIFLVNQGKYVEIAACGNLGYNLNKQNYISQNEIFLTEDLSKEEFIGFGIGLERLMYVYGLQMNDLSK